MKPVMVVLYSSARACVLVCRLEIHGEIRGWHTWWLERGVCHHSWSIRIRIRGCGSSLESHVLMAYGDVFGHDNSLINDIVERLEGPKAWKMKGDDSMTTWMQRQSAICLPGQEGPYRTTRATVLGRASAGGYTYCSVCAEIMVMVSKEVR